MKIKRLLAFVISVAMIVGMVPTFVFAKELDLEADEPETTEAAEAEEEKEEEEKEEEPAQAEDKEEASDAEDKDADEDEEDPDLNVPEESNTIVGAAPSKSQDETVSTSRSAVNGRIGKSKVYWVFSGTVLTVYGKGAMPAWKSEASVPWHRYRDQIKHIYVRSGVTTIGNFAFSNLKNLQGGTIWSYTRGKWKLKSIGNYAFNNTNLGGIPAFKTVSKIGARAFMNSGLVGTITIPKNCKSLGVYAFANNPMTKVALNSKIKSIPNYCFYACALTGVTIPKQVKSIGQWAFAGNEYLKAVTFGKNVSSIGQYAFYYCLSLDNVVLPAKVKAISAYTFDYCTNLKTIKLPSKLKAIGTAAFLYCSNLQSIAIPGTVTSISNSAFSASGLTSVRIPGSVKTIGTDAFYNCSKLSSVTLCSGIKTISAGAFCYTALTGVDIPASVASIGLEAFAGCSKLSSVKLNYGIKSIGDAAFYSTAIKAITLPNSITSLGDCIFGDVGTIAVRTTDRVKTLNSNAWLGASFSWPKFAENTMTVTGKTATVKASKVRKKAQKISVSKLYNFSNPGVGSHLFAKSSGNKKITVAGNGVITVKKGLKKGTYTVKVKVMATGDQTTANTSWQIVTVKVKVK